MTDFWFCAKYIHFEIFTDKSVCRCEIIVAYLMVKYNLLFLNIFIEKPAQNN